MKHGHCSGTKRERPTAQSWYAAVEAETLRQLDAEAAALASQEEKSHVTV